MRGGDHFNPSLRAGGPRPKPDASVVAGGVWHPQKRRTPCDVRTHSTIPPSRSSVRCRGALDCITPTAALGSAWQEAAFRVVEHRWGLHSVFLRRKSFNGTSVRLARKR
jgi:hypothetical protein